MSLPSSGAISMSEIRSELGQTGSISLGDISLRRLSGRLTGPVPMEEFRDKFHMEDFSGANLGTNPHTLGFFFGFGMRFWFTLTSSAGRYHHTLHIERRIIGTETWLPDGAAMRFTVTGPNGLTRTVDLTTPFTSGVVGVWTQEIRGTTSVRPPPLSSYAIFTGTWTVTWDFL